MKKLIAKGLVATAAALMPMAVGAMPAQAACHEDGVAFVVAPGSGSYMVNASTNCNGMVAVYAVRWRDRVRGQYYTGTWVNSTLGWKWLSVNGGPDQNQKIVGETIDGRLLRGQTESHSQIVWIRY